MSFCFTIPFKSHAIRLLFILLFYPYLSIGQKIPGHQGQKNGLIEGSLSRFQLLEKAERQCPEIALLAEQIAGTYLNDRDTKNALKYYKKAMEFGVKCDIDTIGLGACGALAEINAIRGNAKEAIKSFKTYIRLAQKWENPVFESNGKIGLGANLVKLGQMDSAYYYLNSGLQQKIKLKDQEFLGYAYHSMAYYYSAVANKSKALEYYFLAIDAQSAIKDSTSMLTTTSNISDHFRQQQNYKEALKYLNIGVKIAKSIGSGNYLLANLFLKMGAIKEELGQYDEAIADLETALEMHKVVNNPTRLANNLIALGAVLVKKGEYGRAEQILKKSQVLISKNNGNVMDLIESNLATANLYNRTHRYQASNAVLNKTIPKIKEGNYGDHLLEAYRLFAANAEGSNNFKEGFKYQTAYITLKDSIFGIKQSEIIHELEAKYEMAQKENQIAILNAENQTQNLKIQQSQRQKFYLIIGLTLLVGIIASLMYLYRLKWQNARELAQKNKIISNALAEKETLLKEIHHRVKNNLQVISSLLNLQARYIKDPHALDAIKEGRNRVKSMALIHQNLYQEENLVGVNAKDYVEKLIQSLLASYHIEEKQVILEKDVDPIQLDVDTVIPLGLILNELISNALKYAFKGKQNGRIKVRLKEKFGSIQLNVIDNGIGLPKDFNQQKDSSLGFRLIDAFVKKMKAKLEVNQDLGTNVLITIPA